jgi:hypothetical protein
MEMGWSGSSCQSKAVVSNKAVDWLYANKLCLPRIQLSNVKKILSNRKLTSSNGKFENNFRV